MIKPNVDIQRVKELAESRGFSVETENGWQRMFNLKDREIAVICNNCGEVIETSLDREDLFEWLSELTCPAEDKCFLENDERLLTQTGEMQWCLDCYGIVKFMLHAFKHRVPDNETDSFLKEIDVIEKAFFAVNPNTKKSDSSYVFAKCNAPSGYRYVLLRLEETTFNGDMMHMHFAMHNLWGTFENELISMVEAQTSNSERTSHPRAVAALEASLDYYLYLAKELSSGIVDIWTDSVKDDQYLYKYIKQHTCPVCGMPYTSEQSFCGNCDFTDIQRVFVNIDEGQYWRDHTVPEYRHHLFCQHFDVLNGTVIGRKTKMDFRSIIIPTGIMVLAEKSFAESNRLHNLVLPEGLRSIEKEAFDSCYNLKHVSIPTSLKTIGPRAFNYTDINSIRLPEGLASIGEEAFWRCKKLEYIVIPKTITSMGSNVFGGCNCLEHIYCDLPNMPDNWDVSWVKRESFIFQCPAQVHWRDEWHYDEDGNPVIN